jgi:uncharacterized membrane protein YozB (DUF420 family)
MTVHDLPALNAALNATSAILLSAGYLSIRSGHRERHRRFMLAALAVSTMFLTSYVIYHAQVGSVPFKGTGAIRAVYFTILISHVILAIAIVPLVIITVSRALSARFDRHRTIARRTLPLWFYVSVTGVAVYVMLYRM